MNRSNHLPPTCPVVVAIALLGACRDDASGAASPAPPPTFEQLESATVAGIFASPVTLASGRYEGPPAEPGAASRPSLRLMTTPLATGEVDGTPGDEAVAVLVSEEGGSGTTVWLAVFGVRNGRLANLATVALGDRVRVQGLTVRQGRIVVEVVEHGPTDPACCPTRQANRAYAMAGGALRLDQPP